MIFDKDLCFVATEVFAYFGGQTVDEKIPHYINDPETNAATAPELKLYRPKINFFLATLYIASHAIVGILLAILWIYFSANRDYGTLFHKSVLTTIILSFCTLRFTLIWFVRVYQRYAKSETRLRCCMTPSCSEYAILALKKYGAIIGSIKTVRRLFRCHPPGGVDYP